MRVRSEILSFPITTTTALAMSVIEKTRTVGSCIAWSGMATRQFSTEREDEQRKGRQMLTARREIGRIEVLVVKDMVRKEGDLSVHRAYLDTAGQ